MEINQAVMASQENQRNEIGRELHDNLNQILGAAKLYIEMAKIDAEHHDFCLDKSSLYIVQVIEEVRKISKRLITPVYVLGLVESIDMLIEDLIQTSDIEVDYEHKGIDDVSLDEILELNVFRIVQEQLTNIIKHSKATSVKISINSVAEKLTLSVQDNGQGAKPKTEIKGIGIINMKSRALLLGGTVTIKTNPGEGYLLQVEFPMGSGK
jgi:signal transduction histidine kinase